MTVYVDNATTGADAAAASCLWADTGAELTDFTARLTAGGLSPAPHTARVAWIGQRHRTRAILMGAIPVRACDTARVIRASRHRTEVG